jgi:hypothetical protein
MAKFAEFANARTEQAILVNPEHVLTAEPVKGQKWVELVMVMGGGQGGYSVAVEGDLKYVREKLTTS